MKKVLEMPTVLRVRGEIRSECPLHPRRPFECLLRGDTDFSRTEHLDRRDAAGVQFLFGLDAMRKLKAWFALLLPERGRWKELSTLR